ncbi:MAG: heavy metal-responsive transcriptional regulator [Gammaproteobacteria bacterium]
MSFTIGKLARAAGVNIETIRYYERQGLLEAPPRSAAGYRRYTPAAVRRVRFIRQAKALGFSLGEIAELLALRADPTGTCADVRVRVADKVDAIDRKMAELARMRAVLTDLAESCGSTRTPVDECPIVQALDPREPS